MRASLLCALFLLVATGCNDETVAPSAVPPADLAGISTDMSAVAVDMAGAPAADMAGVAGGDMAAARFPMTATVTVGPNGTLTFAPQTVDIAAGGTVTWSWAAGNTLFHNVTSGDATPAFAPSPTQTSGSFTHTFPSAGSFFIFCSVHGRNVMFGTVNVH